MLAENPNQPLFQELVMEEYFHSYTGYMLLQGAEGM